MHAIDQMLQLRSQGAVLTSGGVHYRTWSEHERIELLVVKQNGEVLRTLELQPEGCGYFAATDPNGRAGDLYRYRLGGAGNFPDPASCWQPFGVHGPSMVIDHTSFSWSDADWIAPSFEELVIYELHIGTFTSAGTFRAAVEKLDHIVSLGANALEIMPIADFPGDRNWGYDGVSLYAPSRAYGHPDDLRALVDAAHVRGLAVILDVVYNHLGPDGNYIGTYHKGYWNSRHKTPWGDGLNFENVAVRNFFAENPEYWRREFHVDGFRLDATHTIKDESVPHILAEIAERIHASGGFVVAEDERNEPQLLRSRTEGGLGIDGCWADDFHHSVRVALTGERESYYANFTGAPNELCDTLAHGWHFRGQNRSTSGQPRGGATDGLPPAQFIYCISNHDQVGNRAFGERLGHAISPAAYRAVSALLCLVPQTPMLFMGQEWNASTPFQFFTSHAPELGKKITAGRRREFRHFAAFRDPAQREKIPDPQSEETFLNSKLRWDEVHNAEHTAILALYRGCLQLRRTNFAFRNRQDYAVRLLEEHILEIRYGESLAVIVDLIGGHEMPEFGAWHPLLSSNEIRFGGDGSLAFAEPITLVLAPTLS